MLMRIKSIALIAGLLLPIQAALAVPVINNGSLTGSLGTGTVPAGWSINAGSPDTNDATHNVGGAASFGAAPVGPSPDGGTFVGIGRDDASSGFYESFGQSVSGFVAGTQYELSWYAGNFGADGGLNYLADNAIQVLLDGSPIGTGALLSLGRLWFAESIIFTATAATHQLDFQLAFGPRSYMDIDGIAIAAVTTVPEPATLALLGVALAGLGFARRRTLH